MKGRRSRWVMGATIVLLWCVAMASRSAWRSEHPVIRWQEVNALTPWPVSRARFHWTVSLGDRRLRGVGAMLVDRQGAVQIDLLDPAHVPWARWLVMSRHVAVYLLSERTHYVGYRSGEVVSEALGGHMPVTTWWQQVVTGRVLSLGEPTEVVSNLETGGLEARWSDPPISAVVSPSNVVTTWRIEGSGTGATLSMKPSTEDAFGRPESVVFTQDRPALRCELSFSEWEDVGAEVSASNPLGRLNGFEERPIQALPSAMFQALLMAR